MDIKRTRLLTVTPLILTAMAVNVSAQETSNAISSSLGATLVSASDSATSQGTMLLQLVVPSNGTYAFSAPANSGLSLRLGGETILDAGTDGADGAVKSFLSLTAGTHMVEVAGTDLTMEDVSKISANLIGMPSKSLASISQSLTASSVGTDEIRSEASATSIVDSLLTPSSPSSSGSLGTVTSMVGSGSSSTTSTGLVTAIMNGSTQSGSPAPSGGGLSSLIGSIGGQGGGSTGSDQAIATAITAAINGAPLPPIPRGPEVGDGEAQSSSISPPTGVTLTRAVEITGGATDEGVVASTGQTLFGSVMDQMTYDTVNVTIAPSNRTMTVDVGPMTGQFAVRLFPEDLVTGSATVTVTGASSADATIVTMPETFEFESGLVADGLTAALSRLTYGPTEDLYSRVRMMGFQNYLDEQLNPGRIRNASFNAMNVDRYIANLPDNFNRVAAAEMAHRMAHAAFSDRQLQEVMGAFWSNHFHASTKDTRVYEQNIIDRQFFRDNAFGNFEDLLLYSARSPLMSQFLDNDQNRAGRINENYGREILELHTVGVDGGYSADDVIAVSRVFTGWNFRRTNPSDDDSILHEYAFEFRADRHDSDDKVIPFLNMTIAGRSGAAGVQEGEELIQTLSNDPRTHSYICGKIVEHFVSDEVPQNFVQLCTDAWVASNGNTAAMLRAIFEAPEFLAGAAERGNKSKTPYEYSVSVIRALGGSLENFASDPASYFTRFRAASADGGYDQLRFGLPTGLAEQGSAWVSSATMIGSYRQITDVVENPERYGMNLSDDIQEAGLETAEEVAAYMLSISTADRYTLEEYEAIVSVLKGEDGIFEPLTRNERDAFRRAAGLLIVTPSFLLQ